jgi:hypothetical protein
MNACEGIRTVIQEGLATVDRYPLPPTVEPQRVRDELVRRDVDFRQAGISIICRLTHNPMGFIFAGDVKQAQQEVARLLARLATTTTWAGTGEERGSVAKNVEARTCRTDVREKPYLVKQEVHF